MRLILLVFTLFLVGCGDGSYDDLNKFIQAEKNKSINANEDYLLPLTDNKSEYKVLSSKKLFLIEADDIGEVVEEVDKRQRSFLEGFTISSLTMVGTISRNNTIWALITDSTGVLHKITIGDYIGANSGVVTNITAKKVEISETSINKNNTVVNNIVVMNIKENFV